MKLFKKSIFSLILLVLSSLTTSLTGQMYDHWETLVKDNSTWNYKVGGPDIPSDWINPEHDVSHWNAGRGGFGSEDFDDRTIIENIRSLYIRTEFDVVDINAISNLVLHADYDDGFVAYLNGVEIARFNLGVEGLRTEYDALAYEPLESQIFVGNDPQAFYICEERLSEILKQGENTLAIQIHNHEERGGDFSSNFYLAVAITDDSNHYRSLPHWFEANVFMSQLPIVKITTLRTSAIVDEPKVEAHMGISSNRASKNHSCEDDFNEYDGRIGIELRGTSSQEYRKKSYGFETRKADKSNNNVSLLGMPKENDWVLHGPYADKSLLRNAMTYYMGEVSGVYAPKTRLCELYINHKYQGVYLLSEKIKRDESRVNISKLTENDNSGDQLTGGYIFKVDRNVFNTPGIGWESSFPNYNFVSYVYPSHDEITAAQDNYLQEYYFKFEQAMYSDDYELTYLDFIDLKSWANYFLVTEITKHIDAYKLSFYMHKEKDSKGGKLHMGPLWDFNLGYGNFDFACSADPEGWSYDFTDCGSKLPFWVNRIIEIPNVQLYTSCRWKELRQGPFSTDSLMAYIDGQVSLMGGAVDRNFEKWSVLNNDFVGENYEEEINFLKSWLTRRLAWMDENLEADCDVYVSGTNNPNITNLNVYPNPVQDVLTMEIPHSKGGKIYVYDAVGNEVCNQDIDAGEDIYKFPVHEYADGVYTIRVISSDNSVAYTNRFKRVGQ